MDCDLSPTLPSFTVDNRVTVDNRIRRPTFHRRPYRNYGSPYPSMANRIRPGANTRFQVSEKLTDFGTSKNHHVLFIHENTIGVDRKYIWRDYGAAFHNS
jgi:hypothetical protein